MALRIEPSAADVHRTGAEIFLETARKRWARGKRTAVALSGGSTPLGMYRLLAGEPYRSEMPWSRVHVFWGDERCVSPDHPASNYGAAKSALLDRIPLPASQVHPMPGELPPEAGAFAYEQEMRAFFRTPGGKMPVFDLVFLGMGGDGHTASLFPGRTGLEERKRWVMAVRGGRPDVNRLTLTLPVINRARKVLFLVTGREKARALRTVLEAVGSRLPAQLVRPSSESLVWVVDREAASLLTKHSRNGGRA
jgi:6-phosphogluconolactonase